MSLLQSADSTLKGLERIPSSTETILEGIPMGEFKELNLDQGDVPATPVNANVGRLLKQVDQDTLNKLERPRVEIPTGKENVPCGGSQDSPRRHSKRSVRHFSFELPSDCASSLSSKSNMPFYQR